MLRRLATVSLLLAFAGSVAAQTPNFPTSGKSEPGLEPLDEAVISIMKRHGIPGASLAIAKDGKLVHQYVLEHVLKSVGITRGHLHPL